MVFRSPEYYAEFGELADSAFADGRRVSAHTVRALAMSANRLKRMSGTVWRTVHDARVPARPETKHGGFSMWVPPFWVPLVTVPTVPVIKRHDVVQMEFRARMAITSGRDVQIGVGTFDEPVPSTAGGSTIVDVTGTGSDQAVQASFAVRRREGEFLSFYVRAVVDPDNDSLMDTGTYGTPNTGSAESINDQVFTDDTATPTWTSSVADGGHYVVFRNTSSNNLRGGPCLILRTLTIGTNQPALGFTPAAQNFDAATYQIRKLPSLDLFSVAVREKEPTP